MKTKTVILILLLGLTRIASAQPDSTLHKPYRIGIVVDGPWERNEDMRTLLQNSIREVLGKEARVIFPDEASLVGDWTLAGVRALNDRLLADPQIDMVLGIGLIASQDLATRGPLPKPVIAPIVVDAERQHIPLHNGRSGVKNLSYLVYPQTFERDLQLFREIVPIRKLVNVASARYDEVLPPPLVSLQELGRRLGVEVTELHVDVSADEVLRQLPKDADAVFLEPTLQLPPAEFRKLARGFIDRRLPSFSFLGENEVRQGLMASANPDLLPRLARRIAMNVQRIRDGEEPGALSVAFSPGKRLSMNLATAYAVGVSPKWDVLLEAELVQVDTAVSGGTTITLAEAVRRFAVENLDVQAEARGVSADKANVAIARSVLLPRIDAGVTGVQIDKDMARATGQPERNASFGISGSQILLSEPALANLSIQSSLQESRIHQLAITRYNTVVEGSSLYFNYLRARKIYNILLENLKLTRTNLELARVRQSTGAAGQEEALRWEVEIANLRTAVMNAQSLMNQSLYALKQALNVPLVSQLNVTDISLEDPSLLIADGQLLRYLDDPLSFERIINFLTEESAQFSPELRQLDALISSQERSLTSVRLSYFLPTISAFGKYTDRFYASTITSPFQLPSLSSAPPPGTPVEAFLYNVLGALSPALAPNRTWSVGLQLSLNIFNGTGTNALADLTQGNLERLQLQRRAAVDKVALRIRAEMERTKASHFSMQQATHEQDAARKTLDIVTESYSQGAVSILNLLDAQNAALRADQVAVDALYDFLIDYLSLERAIGEFDVLMTSQQREEFLQRLNDYMTSAPGR